VPPAFDPSQAQPHRARASRLGPSATKYGMTPRAAQGARVGRLSRPPSREFDDACPPPQWTRCSALTATRECRKAIARSPQQPGRRHSDHRPARQPRPTNHSESAARQIDHFRYLDLEASVIASRLRRLLGLGIGHRGVLVEPADVSEPLSAQPQARALIESKK
jgi:hypothetical protein